MQHDTMQSSMQNTFDQLSQFRAIRRRQIANGLDQPSVTPDEVTAKVVEDIKFLRGRIDHIKRVKHARSNPSILKTYETMLESRESILAWLDENYHIKVQQPTQVAKVASSSL